MQTLQPDQSNTDEKPIPELVFMIIQVVVQNDFYQVITRNISCSRCNFSKRGFQIVRETVRFSTDHSFR